MAAGPCLVCYLWREALSRQRKPCSHHPRGLTRVCLTQSRPLTQILWNLALDADADLRVSKKTVGPVGPKPHIFLLLGPVESIFFKGLKGVVQLVQLVQLNRYTRCRDALPTLADSHALNTLSVRYSDFYTLTRRTTWTILCFQSLNSLIHLDHPGTSLDHPWTSSRFSQFTREIVAGIRFQIHPREF